MPKDKAIKVSEETYKKIKKIAKQKGQTIKGVVQIAIKG